jgi:hypothetical protein
MNDNEREMDLALAEAEQENRLLRARNERLERELAGQVALDKKADNARELGLSYDTPLSAFVRSSDAYKAEVMERVIDKAIEAQKEKIGCVNHDCDQCKAQPAPVQDSTCNETLRVQGKAYPRTCKKCGLGPCVGKPKPVTTPPAAQPALPPMHASGLVAIKTLLSRDPCAHAKVAIEMIDAMLVAEPQPVPVKTYHDGKPWPVAPVPNGPYSAPIKELWPVAPKPWVGLSEDEINKLRHLVDWTAEWSYGRFAYELERLLREKNT